MFRRIDVSKLQKVRIRALASIPLWLPTATIVYYGFQPAAPGLLRIAASFLTGLFLLGGVSVICSRLGLAGGCACLSVAVSLAASLLATLHWSIGAGVACAYVLYLIVGNVRAQKKGLARLDSDPSTAHPAGPDVDWIICVSRRFSDAEVSSLYNTFVKPVLETEGVVLECVGADDDADGSDYWFTRMRAMLEMSDIHVLIEHHASLFVQLEHLASRQLQQRPSSTVLGMLLFDEAAIAFKTRPFRIVLSPGSNLDRLSLPTLSSRLGLTASGAPDEFGRKLRRHLAVAKKFRRAGIRNTIDREEDHAAQWRDMAAARYGLASLLASPEGIPLIKERIDALLAGTQQEGFAFLPRLNLFHARLIDWSRNPASIPSSYKEIFEVIDVLIPGGESYMKLHPDEMEQDMVKHGPKLFGFLRLFVHTKAVAVYLSGRAAALDQFLFSRKKAHGAL